MCGFEHLKIKKAIFASILISFIACNNEKQVKYIVKDSDSLSYNTYADSIVYDVIVKVTDREDSWQQECLRTMKNDALLDTLFQSIYNQELVAYSFETKQALSVEDVKQIETREGYSRNIIGKYQFKEKWLYDSSAKRMIKKVQSITFGYETKMEDGTVKGYLPLFIVYFN